MSFIYNFYLSDITNLAAKVALMTQKINNDVEILATLTSVTYVDPNIVIEFTSDLTDLERQIMGNFFGIIFENKVAGVDFGFNSGIFGARRLLGKNVIPTVDYDLTSGFNYGSLICNSIPPSTHICVDPTAGSAVWVSNLTITSVIRTYVSASLTGTIQLDTDQDFTNFNELYDPGNIFNPTTGIYTVPSDGNYEIIFMFNYNASAALTLQIAATDTPGIEIYNNTTATVLLRGLFSILTVNIFLVLNMSAIIGTGQVIVSGIVDLTEGDEIICRYNKGGVSANITLNVGGGSTPSFLSFKKIPKPF